MTTATPLRVRQGELARLSILDAAAEALLHGDPDTVSLSQLAETAGVSARTLYRYFPTRDALMAGALTHLNEMHGLAPTLDPDDIVGSFLSSAVRLAEFPTLLRNLRHTAAGREARSAHRSTRAQELADAVATLAPAGMDRRAVRAAAAVVASLCGSASWATLCDEAALEVADAQAAIAWAIETILDSVQAGRGPELRTKPKGNS